MPPSIHYMNQSAPFWDFVASLENQGSQHPFFGGRNTNTNNNENQDSNTAPRAGPWDWAAAWHHGGMPFMSRGPPPPFTQGDHPPPFPDAAAPEAGTSSAPGPMDEDKPSDGEKPSDPEKSDPEKPDDGHRCRGRRGHGRHGWGPHHHARGHWGQHHRGRGGPCGGPGHRGPGGFASFGGGPAPFWAFLQDMFSGGSGGSGPDAQEDMKPEVDVFDTESAYVIHMSLPGANKEDIGVSWDGEKSELGVAGVVHRPGDESFLKTIAMEERKVGAFERKIRLGTRASPAQVDVEGIVARLENGILVVEVPKLNSDFVEVKKVDVE